MLTLITLYSLRHGLVNRLFAYCEIASNAMDASYASNCINFCTDPRNTSTVCGK